MKKLLVIVSLICIFASMTCILAACNPSEQGEQGEPSPLQITDCFKDFVPCVYFKASYNPQGYEDRPYAGENVSLSQLISDERSIEPNQYSLFRLFTTNKAALIEVNSISFEVVTEKDVILQFNLSLGQSNIYSESVSAKAGVPATIIFSNLHKTWTSGEAGKSEIRAGWLVGEETTFLKLEPVGKGNLVDNKYFIKNLKIDFSEL